jgi:drug/metabolite transporter (DMT)-like permease
MSFGLNYLPGSTYVLLKSTSITFNVALSRITKKHLITKWHFIAVGIVMIAPAFLAAGGSQVLFGGTRYQRYQDREKDVDLGEYIAGFILVVISAFFLGLHYVLSDRLLKKDTVGKVGEYYASAEIAVYSGLFTFLFVIVFILIDYGGITGEAGTWFPEFHNLRVAGESGKFAGISLGGK